MAVVCCHYATILFFFFPSLFCSQDVLIATGNTIQLWDLRQSKRVLGPASSDA